MKPLLGNESQELKKLNLEDLTVPKTEEEVFGGVNVVSWEIVILYKEIARER